MSSRDVTGEVLGSGWARGSWGALQPQGFCQGCLCWISSGCPGRGSHAHTSFWDRFLGDHLAFPDPDLDSTSLFIISAEQFLQLAKPFRLELMLSMKMPIFPLIAATLIVFISFLLFAEVVPQECLICISCSGCIPSAMLTARQHSLPNPLVGISK